MLELSSNKSDLAIQNTPRKPLITHTLKYLDFFPSSKREEIFGEKKYREIDSLNNDSHEVQHLQKDRLSHLNHGNWVVTKKGDEAGLRKVHNNFYNMNSQIYPKDTNSAIFLSASEIAFAVDNGYIKLLEGKEKRAHIIEKSVVRAVGYGILNTPPFGNGCFGYNDKNHTHQSIVGSLSALVLWPTANVTGKALGLISRAMPVRKSNYPADPLDVI